MLSMIYMAFSDWLVWCSVVENVIVYSSSSVSSGGTSEQAPAIQCSDCIITPSILKIQFLLSVFLFRCHCAGWQCCESRSWFASSFPSLCICLFWRLEGDLLIREKSLSGDGIIPIWYRNMIQNTEYRIIPIWFRNLPKEERIHGFMDPGEGEANKEPSPRKALRINDLMPRARRRARGRGRWRGRGRARGRDRFCCNRPVEMIRHLYRKCPPYFLITKW